MMTTNPNILLFKPAAVERLHQLKLTRNLLLVDPVVGSLLPGDELLRLEPEGDLLLGVLDGVGTVADVATDILIAVRINSNK
jgi:hypothetical protein